MAARIITRSFEDECGAPAEGRQTMALSLVDGGLPSRMTFAQWLGAEPGRAGYCPNCGGLRSVREPPVEYDPTYYAHVWCPVCGGTWAGGFMLPRETYDLETGEEIDWKARGVY
jgi:hypothetical protein